MENFETAVTIVSMEKDGDKMKMEKMNYSIDDLFNGIGLNEFDTVTFAPSEKNDGGRNLKEKVRETLPSTKPDFVKGLVEEAAKKYHTFSHNSEHGYEKRVVVGYLTSVGAEEFSKSNPGEFFEVPSGLDFVGIGAEGTLDEKATGTARERADELGLKNNKELTVYRRVMIVSPRFGSLCGSDSTSLHLEGHSAGYGLFERSADGLGHFDEVGEYAGKGSKSTNIQVLGNAGSGFMADSEDGWGYVEGSIRGSSAGAGSEHLSLYIEKNGGDLLLADSKRSTAYAGEVGSYACYNAQEPFLIVDGGAGKLLGEGMIEGNVFVKEIDTYQETGKVLGHSGTGKVTVSDQKYADVLQKENKPSYKIEVDGKFFADNGKSCSEEACAIE